MRFLKTLLALSLFVPSFSRAEVTYTDRGCRVKECGYLTNSTFVAKNLSGSAQHDGSVANRDGGCADTTFEFRELVAGDNKIEMTVTNKFGSKETKINICKKQGGTPPPPTTTSIVPPPPPPPKDKLDLSAVRETSRQQANMIANRIVRLFGALENYRYNFRMGVVDGIEIYKFATGGYRNSQDYRDGYSDGENRGRGEGSRAGAFQGQTDGNSVGTNTAVSRFYEVVDTNRPPRLDRPTFPIPPFGGLNGQYSEGSIEDRLDRRESEYKRYLEALAWRDGDIVVEYDAWYGEWKLSRLYSSYNPSQLVQSYWREDYAFNYWKTHRPDDMDRYWAKINNEEKYENSAEAVNTFISTFKTQYNRVIDEKWRDEVLRPNERARSEGRTLGVIVAKEQAYALGQKDGYLVEYRNGSIQGFRSSYVGAAEGGFDGTVRHYSQNPVVAEVGLDLVDGSGQNRLVPGTPLNLVVRQVTNYGRQSAQLNYSLRQTSGIYQWPAKGFTLNASTSIGRSTSQTKVQTLPMLGEIGNGVAVNRPEVVQVSDGNRQYEVTIQVAWWNVVETVALISKNSAEETSRRKYKYSRENILNSLSREWVELKDKGGYDFGRGKGHQTLIKELSQVVVTLQGRGQDVQQVKEMKAEIIALYGKRPGPLSNARTNWDSAMELLQRL